MVLRYVVKILHAVVPSRMPNAYRLHQGLQSYRARSSGPLKMPTSSHSTIDTPDVTLLLRSVATHQNWYCRHGSAREATQRVAVSLAELVFDGCWPCQPTLINYLPARSTPPQLWRVS